MRDMLGNEIVVGNMVAYPVRQSSSMWMSYGKIVECNEGELNPNPPNDSPYWKYTKHPFLKVEIRSEQRWRRFLNSAPVGTKRVVKVVKLDRLLKIPSAHFSEEDRKFFSV